MKITSIRDSSNFEKHDDVTNTQSSININLSETDITNITRAVRNGILQAGFITALLSILFGIFLLAMRN